MGNYAWLFLLGVLVAMPGPSPEQGEAVLHGFSVGQGTVSITVTDCSCTVPEDFSFQINRLGGDLRMVKVIRRRPDMCLVPALPTTFEYSFEEIGLDEGAHVLLRTPMKSFDRLSNDDCSPIR